jgi:hypothetical protein
MRETVLLEVLRIKISARLKKEIDRPLGVPLIVIQRVEPRKNGPNWELSFKPGDTPETFGKAWARIRHEFERGFDISDG